MLLLTGAILQAACQFYDSESEVRIYCWHNEYTVRFIALNFNGNRAAVVGQSGFFTGEPMDGVAISELVENPNLLKERVFTANPRLLTYDSGKSNSTRTVYAYSTVSRVGFWGENYESHYSYFNFSPSGNSLTIDGVYHFGGAWKNTILERVTLDELLNIYSEVQAERERRARWR